MAAMQDLPLLWGLPFAGLLLTIALAPLLAERFWHHHAGKLALAWSVALLLPWAHRFGTGEAAGLVTHAALEEYLPFLALIFALFTVGGGIVVQGGPWGTPAGNTLLLAIGTVLASIMGTTGAAMVLIHPLLRANAHRPSNTHIVLFFILLVANAGGATTPLGDPPLFIGYLHGVPFLWPTRHLALPLLALAAPLLLGFYWFDRRADAPREEQVVAEPERVVAEPEQAVAEPVSPTGRARRRPTVSLSPLGESPPLAPVTSRRVSCGRPRPRRRPGPAARRRPASSRRS